MARADRRRPNPPRRDRRRWLGWLGWGVLGVGAALLLTPRKRSRPEPAPEPLAEPDAGPALLEQAWIPGPSGALRTVELHPEAGRAIVFVHGLGGRLEHWEATLAALGPGLRGIALDLPGHGGSDVAADGDYTVPALAAAVGATLDAYGLRRAVLVGHSLGALAVLETAVRHPERVAGLLLVDPSGDATRLPAAEREGFLAALVADPHGEISASFRQLLAEVPPELADQVLADLGDTPEEVIAAAAAAVFAYAPLPALEGYAGPIAAVVSAGNDTPNSLHRLHSKLPAARLGSFGHWPMLEVPDAFHRLLDQFLDEVRAQGWPRG